jgi:hypothetical protein
VSSVVRFHNGQRSKAIGQKSARPGTIRRLEDGSLA